MNEIQLSMNTERAEQLSTRIMSEQFIQDGLDESGNEIEAPSEVIQMYDTAIRTGDIPYIDWVVSTYRHYEVPILNTDPFTMLDNASHEALLWLDEQDYTVLPDIVRAIIYDDPLPLYTRDMTKDIIIQVLKRGAWEIYLQYKNDIIKVISNACTYITGDCISYMELLYNIEQEDEAGNDIKDDLLQQPMITQMYNRYMYNHSRKTQRF